MKRALLDDLLAAQANGDPVAVVTHLQTGEQVLVGTDTRGDLRLDHDTLAAIREAIACDRSSIMDIAAGPIFVQVFNPPMRLVVVGAVHIAEPLTRIAALAGYAVAIVDPRRAFTSRRRFEGVTVVDDWPDDALAAVREALARDDCGAMDIPAGRVFVHVFNPPMRLIVVGAVHIAEPLTRMAALAGYAVAIVDPRRAFTSRRRFDGFPVVDDWPDEALDTIGLDRRTAVVSLAHDPKIDDPALTAALRSSAFYIGALGSRKTHAARLERLRRAGFSDTDLDRVHGPVGLSIGALTPAEIALSIMADITQVRRQGEVERV